MAKKPLKFPLSLDLEMPQITAHSPGLSLSAKEVTLKLQSSRELSRGEKKLLTDLFRKRVLSELSNFTRQANDSLSQTLGTSTLSSPESERERTGRTGVSQGRRR